MHKIGLPNGKQKFFINPKNANFVKLLINCTGYVPNCEQGIIMQICHARALVNPSTSTFVILFFSYKGSVSSRAKSS